MARNLSEIIIIDLEATCYTDEEKKVNPNLISEIIEIGISRVDLKNLEITSSEGILVKPKFSEVSDFCTQLTTITPAMLENQMDYPSAVEYIKKNYKIKDTTWGSWGDYDKNQFAANDKLYGIESKYLGRTHQNIKNWFSVSQGYTKEFGLDKALNILGMTMEGTHHRGVDDAKNIAKVFIELAKKTRAKV